MTDADLASAAGFLQLAFFSEAILFLSIATATLVSGWASDEGERRLEGLVLERDGTREEREAAARIAAGAAAAANRRCLQRLGGAFDRGVARGVALVRVDLSEAAELVRDARVGIAGSGARAAEIARLLRPADSEATALG